MSVSDIGVVPALGRPKPIAASRIERWVRNERIRRYVSASRDDAP